MLAPDLRNLFTKFINANMYRLNKRLYHLIHKNALVNNPTHRGRINRNWGFFRQKNHRLQLSESIIDPKKITKPDDKYETDIY